MNKTESDSEMLREALTDMEHLRQRELDRRRESETLFETLLDLLGTRDRDKLYDKLMDRLKTMVPFKDAFVLRLERPGVLLPHRRSPEAYRETSWVVGPFLERVLAGRPLVAHEVASIEEWQRAISASAIQEVACALHVPIISPYRQGILVCTHGQRGGLGRSHARLAERFYPLVSQVMLQLDMHEEMLRRERLFHLNPNLLAVLNSQGKFIELNGAWSEQLGLGTADLLQMNLMDIVAEVDRDRARGLFESLASGDSCREEINLVGPDSKSRPYLCACVRAEDGNFYWSGQDVSLV